MIPHFRIQRVEYKKYIIKRKVWLLYPFYTMRRMTRDEFFGDITAYGEYVMSEHNAEFKSLDDAYSALHIHAMIKGYPEVILKVKEKD
jgi:hypothetical protein